MAQDALEAGFDGPHVLRMAVLEPVAGWAINQALPLMVKELGCLLMPLREAALRLARQRAMHILQTAEDPFLSVPYFHRLMLHGDYPTDLIELGYLDEEGIAPIDPTERLTYARQALNKLLSPEVTLGARAEGKMGQ